MTTPGDRLPTKPRAFGEELQRQRLAAGMSLQDIVEETKISLRVLEALESGAFGYLPERVFSRNFVIQVGRLTGADVPRLTEAFDAAWERFLLTSGSHPALAVADLPQTQRFEWSFWIPLALGAVILAAVAAVIVRGWSRPETTLPPDPRRSAAARPSPTVPATRLPATGTAVESQPTTLIPQPSETVDIAIEVREGRECWVYFRDRNGRTDQRLVAGGARLQLTLAGPVKLTLGNAGAVTVATGGQRYADLGGYGEVVHAHVGADGLRRLRGGETDGG